MSKIVKSKQTIRYFIERSFVLACSLILITAIFSAVYASNSHISSFIACFILVGSAILILLFAWFRRVLQKRLLNPLTLLKNEVSKAIKSPLDSACFVSEIKEYPNEIDSIKNAFQNLLMNLQAEYKNKTETEKKTALLDLAARVAHDIRSPIAVMEMSLAMLPKDIPQEKTLLMREAIQGIRDIANNLLDRYRDSGNQSDAVSSISLSEDNGNSTRPILLYSLVETVVSQKRHEWQKKSFELTFESASDCKFVWVNIAPNELKRALSNLLNNAFEALNNEGIIQILLHKKNDHYKLVIVDNGYGIPAEKIPQILKGTSLKHPGIGLGLSGAKKYMEELGGTLEIFSEENKGTTVVLNFYETMTPDWFPSSITIKNFNTVIVLDDNVAMQSLWAHRLRSYHLPVKQFLNYHDAVQWYEENPSSSINAVFIVDYELGDDNQNGLSFLTYANVKNNGYLVTSHSEEINIQTAVKNTGVWLVPKILASDIPIID